MGNKVYLTVFNYTNHWYFKKIPNSNQKYIVRWVKAELVPSSIGRFSQVGKDKE